jgi:DNA-binding beta-propeller fold protein YncE
MAAGDKIIIAGDSTDFAYGYDLSTAYDLSTGSYASESFNFDSEDEQPYSIFFRDNGEQMYMLGVDNDTVYQYTLSTPWDVSTASYDSKSASIGTELPTPAGLAFKSDGSRMYVCGRDASIDGIVAAYDLSTDWDVSTASYASEQYDTETETGPEPSEVRFNSDGSKMFVLSGDNEELYEYDLSTDWDVSTASYSSNSLDVSGQMSSPFGFDFSTDGEYVMVMSTNTDTIYGYNVTTGFDLSSTSYNSDTLSLGSQDGTPRGMFVENGGGGGATFVPKVMTF